MPYKHLFSQSLAAIAPRRHFAAHSHHLWPDIARAGQMAAFDDALRLADDKWGPFFEREWPQAQAHVAAELNLPDASTITFAPNSHSLLIALFSSIETKPVHLLTTDGEFHSLSRQAARWEESGHILCERVPVMPSATFEARFIAAAKASDYDIILTSQVFFNSGYVLTDLESLAALGDNGGPLIVIDGYHGFKAIETDLSALASQIFYIGGGYKYAMAGEGCAFMHAPFDKAERPEITGWYAAFGDLIAPASGGVGYARDASRFMGATFDPSGIYRFNAVQDMLAAEGLTTPIISAHVNALQLRLTTAIKKRRAGALQNARFVNDTALPRSARFIALEHEDAQDWQAKLHAAGIITDVRGDVLRIGLALYHDGDDIDDFCDIANKVL
ncbi:MAG: hypothetical protein V3U82_02790 [Robiginitomaculum sp.]